MAFGVTSILNMGIGALFASQASIQTTGNNIANVNTPGYSRQGVRLEDNFAIDYYPGQMGQGVSAKEVFRYFDRFIESAYLDRYSSQRRYEEEYSLLREVEVMFNEATSPGIGNGLNALFTAWNDLAKQPSSLPARAALLEKAETLAVSIRSIDGDLQKLQEDMETRLQEQVNKANTLIREIAELNREINIHTVEGRNNANGLLDTRDSKSRELAGILDIHVDDKGAGHYIVTTGSGMMLVQEDIPFSLAVQGQRAENNLSIGSAYDGVVEFSGTDGYEYTLDVLSGGSIDRTGAVPPPVGTATYRVSLDGGQTWIPDETTGQPKVFYATDTAHSSRVKDLDVGFTGIANLSTGDKFLLTPKTDVYWVRSTSGPLDISTAVNASGLDSGLRITGGTLGGYLEFRDYKVGEYRDRLAAFTDALVWEVNRIHSQGAGLDPLQSSLGTTAVGRTDLPLGSPSARFHFADKLQSGNMTFAIYDSTTGKQVLPYPGIDVFAPNNFDPTQDSLEDIRDAINIGPAGGFLTASIIDNRLQVSADPGFTFNVTADTTGLAAGLGMNTFFAGTTPTSLALNESVRTNLNRINAARVNGAGEGNLGDNITARELASLSKKAVPINSFAQRATTQPLSEYYATMVAKIGADTQGTKFTAASQRTMAGELDARREEISGVNMDEEMSNLIKFQASYKAAAKLITTADEMLQTLLSLKQ